MHYQLAHNSSRVYYCTIYQGKDGLIDKGFVKIVLASNLRLRNLIYCIERNSVCLSVFYSSETARRTNIRLGMIDHLLGTVDPVFCY